MSLAVILSAALRFYLGVIVVYILMSWFPIGGVIAEIYHVLGTIVEPYLGLFRRFIPPIGMIDISPIVAILVLQFVGGWIIGLLAGLGL